MIITSTPFRMSFFGGGTDIPAFFNEHGGSVLSTTFNKYCYVNVKHLPQFFDYSTELTYSEIERITSIDDIRHPAIRNAMKMLNMSEIRLTYEADLPARTGLGTSSSFAVGMLSAFHCLEGSFVSKDRLAREAIYLERVACGEAGGWQDQIAASFGGLNRIVFKNNDFEVLPIIISPQRKRALESSLMLFFTGFTRFSADVQKTTVYRDKTGLLLEMLALVDEAERVLVDDAAPIARFGELLDETWRLKRGIGSRVSTGTIDDLYQRAIDAGATGGKLLGAGGGGFLLFFVEEDKRDRVSDAFSDFMRVPFSFEEGGTKVIHYSPEEVEVGEARSTTGKRNVNER